MTTVTAYPECHDCGRQFYRECRYCNNLLCKRCYNYDGLCESCREREINGDDD